MNSNDELLIQRFADGELSEEQQVEFLARCDVELALWRALALAFAEQQTWDAALRMDLPAAADSSGKEPSADRVAHPVSPVTAKQRRRTFDSVLWSTSLALVLFLGVLIGRYAIDTPGSDVPLTFEGHPPGSFLAAKAEDGEEMINLSLNLTDGQRQNVRIPVVQAANNDSLLAAPNVFRQDVLDHIRQAGYGIDQYRELLPVQLPDGRNVVVPVDNLRVRKLSPRDLQ